MRTEKEIEAAAGDLRLYGWVQFFPSGIAADVPAASAEIHRHALLDRRRDALCARQSATSQMPELQHRITGRWRQK